MSVDIQTLLAKAVEANPSILMGIFQQLAAAPKVESTPAPKVEKPKKVGEKERTVGEFVLTDTLAVTYSLKKSKQGGVYVIIRFLNRLRANAEMGHVYLYKADFLAFVNHIRGAQGTTAFNAVISGGITEYVKG